MACRYTAACLSLLLAETKGGGSVTAVDSRHDMVSLAQRNIRRAGMGMASTR